MSTVGSTLTVEIRIVEPDRSQELPDELAVEAPLEIGLAAGAAESVVAVTLRTPGQDDELALGLLHAEGVIGRAEEVGAVRRPVDDQGRPDPHRILVRLAADRLPDLARLERSGLATAACGLCGRTRLEAVALPRPVALAAGPRLDTEVLLGLPATMRRAQATFATTGGLHAAALFTPEGELLGLREDVGRHNAVDKLVGWALLSERLPLDDTLLLVSGRAGYELVSKALVAGCPILAAVSAPSSLAVATARDHRMTLIGFLREGRCNVYSGAQRLDR